MERAPEGEIGQFIYPTKRIFSLEFNFHYLAYAKFANRCSQTLQ